MSECGFGKDGYELYDLSKDPGEFTNEANNAEYKAALEHMREQLERKRVQASYQGKVTQKHADGQKAIKARRAKLKSLKW